MPLKKINKNQENKERKIRQIARTKAEKIFGKTAIVGKDVSHVDGNNLNNSPGNLKLKSHKLHGKQHGRSHGKRGTRNIKK